MELQALFREDQQLNAWVVTRKTFMPAGFAIGTTALLNHNPVLSFFAKHRIAFLAVGIGLLAVGITIATGGFFALAWIAALPFIAEAAVVISSIVSLAVTAAVLAKACLAVLALISFGVSAFLTKKMAALANYINDKNREFIEPLSEADSTSAIHDALSSPDTLFVSGSGFDRETTPDTKSVSRLLGSDGLQAFSVFSGSNGPEGMSDLADEDDFALKNNGLK